MSHRHNPSPAAISLLADHLDTALAACDDLLATSAAKLDPHAALRLELTAITHILQARQSMEEMALDDRDLSRSLVSFVSRTDPLETPSAAQMPHFAPGSGSDVRLIGGRIPAADLKSALVALLAALGSRYALEPDDGADEASPPSAGLPPNGGAAQIWALGPEA